MHPVMIITLMRGKARNNFGASGGRVVVDRKGWGCYIAFKQPGKEALGMITKPGMSLAYDYYFYFSKLK